MTTIKSVTDIHSQLMVNKLELSQGLKQGSRCQ